MLAKQARPDLMRIRIPLFVSLPPHGLEEKIRGWVRPRSPGALRSLNTHVAILARVTRSDGASVPDDHVIVLFGALGDLSKRKLLPGLFHLDRAGLMPANYRIIGTSRK